MTYTTYLMTSLCSEGHAQTKKSQRISKKHLAEALDDVFFIFFAHPRAHKFCNVNENAPNKFQLFIAIRQPPTGTETLAG